MCWRSRNQEVPGVSLPTFSTRESRPGRGAERPLSEGVGAVLPHWGAQRGRQPLRKKGTRVQGGAPAGGCRDCRPAKAPGARGGAPALGGCGGKAPQEAPGCPPTRGRKRKTGSAEGAAPLVHPLAWERSRAQRTPCEKAGVLSKFTICLSASSICVI